MSERWDPSLMRGMNDRVKGKGRERSEVAQQPNWAAIATPISTYPPSNQPVETLYQSQFPPSVCDAVENPYCAPPVENPYQGLGNGYASSDEDLYRTCAPSPLAFSSRSHQLGQNYGLNERFTYPEPSYPIIYQASELYPVAENFLGLQTPENSNRHSLSTFSESSQDSFYSHSRDSLQYHLLGVNAARLETRSAPKRHLTPESSHSSQATSSNDDDQVKRCRICIDKDFRGNDAQRNLNRHMENKHPSSDSANSTKQYPCKDAECDSTFSRNDAFLVHARRSHPELEVPAAKPRNNSRKKVKTNAQKPKYKG